MISLYVGNGLKYTDQEFFPKFPYYIHSEPVDRDEENEVIFWKFKPNLA